MRVPIALDEFKGHRFPLKVYHQETDRDEYLSTEALVVSNLHFTHNKRLPESEIGEGCARVKYVYI